MALADIVIDVNAPAMFTAHRPGCADLRKAERAGRVILRAIEPTPAAIRASVAGPNATPDDYSLSARDIASAPCMRTAFTRADAVHEPYTYTRGNRIFPCCRAHQKAGAFTRHAVRTERRRGFQPPYYTVVIYRCEATGIETVIRANWRGGAPAGAIVGNCGHRVSL